MMESFVMDLNKILKVVLIVVCFFSHSAYAHNKVVVVPLGGNEGPGRTIFVSKENGYINDIQKAIDSVKETATRERPVSINIGPGTFNIDEIIELVPYVSLVGAGVDETIIRASGNQGLAYLLEATTNNASPLNYRFSVNNLTLLNESERSFQGGIEVFCGDTNAGKCSGGSLTLNNVSINLNGSVLTNSQIGVALLDTETTLLLNFSRINAVDAKFASGIYGEQMSWIRVKNSKAYISTKDDSGQGGSASTGIKVSIPRVEYVEVHDSIFQIEGPGSNKGIFFEDAFLKEDVLIKNSQIIVKGGSENIGFYTPHTTTNNITLEESVVLTYGSNRHAIKVTGSTSSRRLNVINSSIIGGVEQEVIGVVNCVSSNDGVQDLDSDCQ